MELKEEQWQIILSNGLGLRSCSCDKFDSLSTGFASYAMSEPPSAAGVNYFNLFRNVPTDWKTALINTLELILGFENSRKRILCIVFGVRGTSFDYSGCFAKSSSRYQGIITSRKLQNISKENIQDLANWVIEQIPSNQLSIDTLIQQ